MANDLIAVVTEIVHAISRVYPSLEVYVEETKETGEYFVLIDDKDIYYSGPFQSIVMRLTKELLWDNGIYNVYFGYEDIPEAITYEPLISASVYYMEDDFTIDISAEQFKDSSVTHDYLLDLSMAA